MYLDRSGFISRWTGGLCAITASIGWRDVLATIGLSILGTFISYYFSKHLERLNRKRRWK